MDDLGSRQLDALSRIDGLLERAGIEYWLFGGWAVDFYVASITRAHDDVDIAVWLEDVPAIHRILEKDGWRHAPTEDADGGTQYEQGRSASASPFSFAMRRGRSSSLSRADLSPGRRSWSAMMSEYCWEYAPISLASRRSCSASPSLAVIPRTKPKTAQTSPFCLGWLENTGRSHSTQPLRNRAGHGGTPKDPFPVKLTLMSSVSVVDPNMHDRFILRQRFRPVVNEYEFSLPEGSSDEPGPPFCFVRQRRFAFKEDIRFYVDDSRSIELMRIKARQRFDPAARYDVTAADGSKIGEIQKVFGASLLRSTYRIYDATGAETATAMEQSLAVALLRRLVGLVPYLEHVANWLPIPYHFTFKRGEVVLGSHRRHVGKLRDIYTTDMSGDPERSVDRRLVLAIAVGMDALQAR